jgi:hypothetical protein
MGRDRKKVRHRNSVLQRHLGNRCDHLECQGALRSSVSDTSSVGDTSGVSDVAA